MAAGEQHPQPVVRQRRDVLVEEGRRGRRLGQRRQASGERAVAADAVQRLAPRRRRQPRARAVRYAAAVPVDRRGEHRL